MKKMLSAASRIALMAGLCLVGTTGMASPWLPLPSVSEPGGHVSSLRARVVMADGSARTVTVEGVGCTERICSRVRALDREAVDIWLDGLATIRPVSREADGSVGAMLSFKDGTERQAAINTWNRVLYVDGRFGRTEKLDLGEVARIDFE